MPKIYTMMDSTGQLWNNINEDLLPQFMQDYPEATTVSVEDDEPVQLEQPSIEIDSDPNKKYRDKLQKDLSGYDPVREILVKTYEDLPTETRMKLTDKDAKIAATGNLQNISDQGKRIILTDYTFPSGWTGNKDFNGFIEVNKQAKETFGLDESSEYDSKLNKYNQDLNNALLNVKEGEIPTNILDGDLGAKIVGHEEEQVYKTLNKLYGSFGFEFEETGLGDNIKVYAPNGQATEISLDNWTNAGDKEQAGKLKSFLDLNKGEYKPKNLKEIATIIDGDLDVAAIEKIAKDKAGEGEWDWLKNWYKEDKLSAETIRKFDAAYDEDVVKEESQKLNNSLISINKQMAENQAAVNTYKKDVALLEDEIKNGNLTPQEIEARRTALLQTQTELVSTGNNIQNIYEKEIKPLQAQLQVVNAKKYVVESEKGNIAGITGNTVLGVVDKISTYFNSGMLALKEDDIKEYWKGNEEQAKKALQREAKLAISNIKDKYGADVTNEYEQEFNATVLGGVYTSMVEMGSMMLAAGLTGTGPVGYGAMMGLSIAGGEMEEMLGEDFDGLSMKERFLFATAVGTVNGLLEAAGAKFGKIFGGGKNPVTNYVKKDVVGKVFSRLAGKNFTRAAITKATNEIVKEGVETGIYALGKAGLRAGISEAGTEAAQEVATRGMKQVVNMLKEDEVFDKAANEITLSNITRAGAMGFLAGGPIGVISAGSRAAKSKSIDKISNSQYKLAKTFTLNPEFQKMYSEHIQLRVLDPNDSMTKEMAENHLRDLKEQGGMMRELDDMSLTIEGEKQAFKLLDKKRSLQKQIDKATDKAIVKKQREDITAIDKQLEAISLEYNFETAFEAGLEVARQRTLESEKQFQEFDSSEDFEAKMKELGQQDDAGFRGTSGYIDNDGNIYINREAAKNLRDISVGQHELLHGVVGKQIGNVAPETVQGFKDSLTNKELEVVEKRLKEAYGVTNVEDANAEEYFNALVDGVVKGDIVYDENIFTKIGDWLVKNVFGPMGFTDSKLGFSNGRQVYNFVKDYAKQSKRIAEGQQEGFEGEVGDIVAEGTAARPAARSVQDINATDLAAQYKDGTIDSDNITNFIEQYHKLGLRAMKFDTSKGDIARDEAISFLNKEFESVVRNYDPTKNIQFSTYLNSVIPKRAVNFYEQQIGDKAKTTSTDSDKAKQIAADDTPTKDNRTPREIRQAERKGIKVREKTPGIYNVDKIVKAIRSKAKQQNMKGKTLKQLKGFALREVVDMIARDNKDLADSMFKKITNNSNLKSDEMLAIQKFINSNIDLAKGSLLEGFTSEFKSTGVNKKLLEKFYNKRSARAKTKPGLKVQIKKPNIKDSEIKEAFGITDSNPDNWVNEVVASKGGVSDILKGFVRNFDQVISSQEIREQLIEDGEPVEALRTLSDGMPSGFFSTQTLGNLDIEAQIAILDLLTSDTTLELAEKFRTDPKNAKSNWLGAALKALSTPEFRKQYGVVSGVLQKIGDELQIELDPKKSWQKYVKKAADVRINEVKIGIYSTLKQIAKARKLDIKTGSEVYEDLDDINLLRSDIVTLIEELKLEEVVDENGISRRAISDAEISKYILPALVGSYKMGRYKLKNNRKAPSIKLTEGEVFIDEGNIRQGIFGSATDAEANVNIDSKEKLNKQIYAHDAWYNRKLSRDQQKKYGVEFFDDLPLEKRAKFVKNEIQPDGLRAKEILDLVVKKMASLRSENKITAQAASVFIDLQFARMDGLGKLASDVRFIPNNTKSDLKKIFKLPKVKRGKNKDGSPKYIEDPFVLEHTIPGNRVKLAAFNAILGGDKASMDLFESELEQYHSAIIPFYFDSLVNRKDGKELYLRTAPAIREAGDFALSETGRYADDSIFPMSLYDVSDDITYGQPQQLEETIEESRESNGFASKQSGIQTDINKNGFFSKTNEDILNDFSKMDKALAIANSLNQPVKKIRVFDFDDTLAYTKSDVLFTAPDGTTGKLNAEEFAKQGKELLDQGYKFDFSEFNKVTKGKPGPLLDIAKKIKAARGNEDLFVLTARAPEAQQAIYEFLKSQGVEFKKQNIIGLGNSTGEAKAQWLVGKAAEGYNDFYFADDAVANVAAVKKAMSVLDVKSKIQQARGKFSKQLSDDFNKIIEETKNIGAEKTYSKARAQQIGSSKGKGKFWIPYSAEDMLGLIYPLLGKGKVGDAQMKWFRENLFNPFSKAMDSLASARVQLMADFEALKKNLDVPKDLQKEAFDNFTNEQVVRMYIWDSQGMEVPGLSKRDLADVKKVIEGNEKLKTFAEELIKINKEDGYPKPSKSWLAGTITTDLIDGLNDVKRPKYLQQWQENVDAIFSEQNLNKLEATYGSKYREALENMLTRMKTGKNRIEGSNRLSDRLLNWINGSVGAIMFFNTRSAVLQLISSINFINWNDNNIYAAGKAFANQKQYWSDFKKLMNSDFLVDRRNGLKINISESEIADAAKTSKNKARAVLNYILKKGFLPTQIADSFAIASGGATFYRNRINTYISEGMTQAEAEAQAFQDFRELAEESQQSSRPDKISQQQASSLGRLLLAFANTPMQYGRLTKRAYQDLVAGRGDRKSNISKIIYYTAVQNLIFNALQAGIQMLGFGDDEEKDEDKEKTYTRVANGMADSLLRGLGIGGAAVSVSKNFLMDLYERSGRSRPEYVDSIYKLLQFSPPISSKISRLRQAAWMFDSKQRRKEIYEKGFALDNPAYEAAGKVISATTNLPVDRVYNKVNNIDAALAEDTETWETIAMLLGWPEWQIKPPKKKKTKKKRKKGGYRKIGRTRTKAKF